MQATEEKQTKIYIFFRKLCRIFTKTLTLPIMDEKRRNFKKSLIKFPSGKVTKDFVSELIGQRLPWRSIAVAMPYYDRT